MSILEKANSLFYAFFVITLLAVATNFVSFVSPFWIQSVPSSHSQFIRIGLWTVCFNGYMRPTDFSKAYFGCYYIYYIEYDRIRDWINPLWLYAIQGASSLGMLFQSLVAFMVICQATSSIDKNDSRVLKFNLIGHFYTCFSLTASLVAFAVARYDSTWMPYPRTNILSWSYVVAIISLVLSLVAFLIGFIRYMYLEALQYMVGMEGDPLLGKALMDVEGISSPPMFKEFHKPLDDENVDQQMKYEDDNESQSQFDPNYPAPPIPQGPRPSYQGSSYLSGSNA